MHHAARAGVIVKLAQQRCQIAGSHVGQRNHAGHDFIPFTGGGIAGDRDRGGFGIFRTYHFEHAVIHIDNGKTIDIQYAEEKLIILLFVEHIVTTDGNGAAYAGVNDDRFIQVFTHGINKFLNVGSLKAGGEFFRVQRPE